MFIDNIGLFALDKEELIVADVEPFEIILDDPNPHAKRYLRYNRKMAKFIDKEVQDLLDKGLIYSSNSSYAAKVILAPKGDSWRMCLNSVGVNKKTVRDRYP